MLPPFARGERVRITDDVGRRHVAGFEGTVDMVTASGVVVILDNDPATQFRVSAFDTFQPLNRPVIRRFFHYNELEKLPGNNQLEC